MPAFGKARGDSFGFSKNRLKTRNIRQELGPLVMSGIPPAGRTAT
jgi:hypothetical protein